MALFTVTINNLAPALEKKSQELERINRYVEKALRAARNGGGVLTSGNIIDDTGTQNIIGTWTYTAQGSLP